MMERNSSLGSEFSVSLEKSMQTRGHKPRCEYWLDKARVFLPRPMRDTSGHTMRQNPARPGQMVRNKTAGVRRHRQLPDERWQTGLFHDLSQN